MLVQLTTFGVDLIQNSTGPVVLSGFKLGSSFGYVPPQDQTDIHGTLVYQGVPTAPNVQNSNFVQYELNLPENAGPFDFGEAGLYYGTHLVAICVFDALIHKTPLNPNNNTGGGLVIAFNIPMTGTNYEMWVNVAQANTNKVSVVQGPEELPQFILNAPNLFVVETINGSKPYLAYTDRQGLWSFDAYSVIGVSTCISGSTNAFVVPGADVVDFIAGNAGQLLVQGISGDAFAAVRYVTKIVVDQNTGRATCTLNAPFTTPMVLGDRVEFYKVGAPSTTTENITSLLTVKTKTGNYTLEAEDQFAMYVRIDSPIACNVTLPAFIDVPLPIGTNLLIGQAGIGQVSVVPAANVTLLTPSTNVIASQNAKIAALKVDTDVWEVEGNLYQPI